ncbi:MAG: hypothetical protein KFW09_04825 [Oscillospiraceae bacterium]|nr:hypothetical protein [Oscillospiraceae bacterium]
MEYIMIKSTKKKIKLYKNIYLKDLSIILSFFFLSIILKPIVHPNLGISFQIFMVIIGIILVIPSPTNRGKPIYKSLFYTLKKKNMYKNFGGEVDEISKN